MLFYFLFSKTQDLIFFASVPVYCKPLQTRSYAVLYTFLTSYWLILRQVNSFGDSIVCMLLVCACILICHSEGKQVSNNIFYSKRNLREPLNRTIFSNKIHEFGAVKTSFFGNCLKIGVNLCKDAIIHHPPFKA